MKTKITNYCLKCGGKMKLQGGGNGFNTASNLMNTAGDIANMFPGVGTAIGAGLKGLSFVSDMFAKRQAVKDNQNLIAKNDRNIPIYQSNESVYPNPNQNMMQTGGVPTQGGVIQPVSSTGSVALGQTHDEGGIKYAPNIEVENKEGIHNVDDKTVVSSNVLKNPLTGKSFASEMVGLEKQKGDLEIDLKKELDKSKGKSTYTSIMLKKRIDELEVKIGELYEQQEALASKMGLRDEQGNPNQMSQQVVGNEEQIQNMQQQVMKQQAGGNIKRIDPINGKEYFLNKDNKMVDENGNIKGDYKVDANIHGLEYGISDSYNKIKDGKYINTIDDNSKVNSPLTTTNNGDNNSTKALNFTSTNNNQSNTPSTDVNGVKPKNTSSNFYNQGSNTNTQSNIPVSTSNSNKTQDVQTIPTTNNSTNTSQGLNFTSTNNDKSNNVSNVKPLTNVMGYSANYNKQLDSYKKELDNISEKERVKMEKNGKHSIYTTPSDQFLYIHSDKYYDKINEFNKNLDKVSEQELNQNDGQINSNLTKQIKRNERIEKRRVRNNNFKNAIFYMFHPKNTFPRRYFPGRADEKEQENKTIEIGKFKTGGQIQDNNGYLKSNLHNYTPVKLINSNHITTKNMAFPIEANGKVLYPNTGDYYFKKKPVVEKPLLFKYGGASKVGTNFNDIEELNTEFIKYNIPLKIEDDKTIYVNNEKKYYPKGIDDKIIKELLTPFNTTNLIEDYQTGGYFPFETIVNEKYLKLRTPRNKKYNKADFNSDNNNSSSNKSDNNLVTVSNDSNSSSNLATVSDKSNLSSNNSSSSNLRSGKKPFRAEELISYGTQLAGSILPMLMPLKQTKLNSYEEGKGYGYLNNAYRSALLYPKKMEELSNYNLNRDLAQYSQALTNNGSNMNRTPMLQNLYAEGRSKANDLIANSQAKSLELQTVLAESIYNKDRSKYLTNQEINAQNDNFANNYLATKYINPLSKLSESTVQQLEAKRNYIEETTKNNKIAGYELVYNPETGRHEYIRINSNAKGLTNTPSNKLQSIPVPNLKLETPDYKLNK